MHGARTVGLVLIALLGLAVHSIARRAGKRQKPSSLSLRFSSRLGGERANHRVGVPILCRAQSGIDRRSLAGPPS
jgi:hypothetical protein